MKLDDLTLPDEIETVGLWVESEILDGVAFRVRRLYNTDMVRATSKAVSKIPPKDRKEGLDPSDDERITGLALLDHVLYDWRGFEDGDGKPIPYSKDLARKFLLEPRYVKIRRAIIAAAGAVEKDGKVSLEADAKN